MDEVNCEAYGYGNGGYGDGNGYGDGYGYSYGYGDCDGDGCGCGGYGNGSGYGSGHGCGDGGYGNGSGYGSGYVSGDGYGDGYGYGSGHGDGAMKYLRGEEPIDWLVQCGACAERVRAVAVFWEQLNASVVAVWRAVSDSDRLWMSELLNTDGTETATLKAILAVSGRHEKGAWWQK